MYLRNRSPTKSVGEMTPYEGSKPNVSALRVFGCSAYAHVPKVQRRKLNQRSVSWWDKGRTRRGIDCTFLSSFIAEMLFEETLPGIESEK